MEFKQFATRNVLRNGKAYFAYFLSTIISVTLFFSLTTFILHPDKGTFKSYIKVSLLGAEMIAYLFLFFFVFYSISVLLKKRYKEFGILYMLGTSRRQLLKMISIENMIISVAATIGGIVTGLVFSKLFLTIIEKLLRLPSLPFYFPIKAILITLVCFLLLGMFVSLFTSWIVKEKDILRLLKATKAPKPAPKFSQLIAVFGFLLLIAGYALSFVPIKGNLGNFILFIIGMVVIATYLLFSQFSVFAIALLKKNRSYYLRNTNLIWVSNLFYRIRDNARMFFIITITSTAAVILSGASYAFWTNTLNDIEERHPLAFTYQIFGKNPSAAEEIRFIEDQLKKNHFPYEKIVVDIKYLIQEDGSGLPLMKASVYNQFAKQLNLKTVSIREQEAIIIVPPEENDGINRLAIEGNSIRITEEIRAKLLHDQFYAIYVVDDRLFDRIEATEESQPQYEFHVKDWSGTYVVYDEYEKKYGDNQTSLFLSKSHIYETEKRAYGTIMFLSIFLGIIFFVASGSFIYNKFYMDQETDKQKYKQLHKIGVTFKEIKKVVSIEIGVLFLFPYIVATMHSAVALGALQRLFKIEVGAAAVTVMGIFLLLQIVYFLFIRRNYLNVIKKHLTFS
ncbi:MULTISPECIES: ABC transporter permease [unclassified Paenibacillus]|uniref:ABC transporter permease n=1 Tax=unclassified Paenibacillus TaxID=185978 RepID=UPI00278250F2|nr:MULTISPECIES: ABC transporter permease [unclassified Paenibacillus]MDQ0900925.1 putative ABC transport system permease protein [Paenibacillus sp. V4I7]MDQ0920575.1 putative ABC transport system permease protein [Paenibacillus sp. V4I5]